MKTNFDIEKLIEIGSITNELDYERAMIADRKLRILAKENAHFRSLRTKLRTLIEEYEKREWSNLRSVTDKKITESEKYEQIAEQERVFIHTRKQKIKDKLKVFDLTQENLGHILGHKSKTHMSELMNGIKPFTLRDLVLIHRLLKIDIKSLVPVFLSVEDQIRVKSSFEELNKPNIKLQKEDLMLLES